MAVLDEVLQTLEIQPTGIPTVVRLSQNENGRQIRLTLRGQETAFPTGCLVTISGTKPDGVVYSAEGALDGNVAVISEDTQMTAVAGMWKARVQVTYGGSTIATELICFEVYADPVDPDSVPSESEITGLVAQAQYWAENAKSSAYGSPLTASTAAEMTETDRVYVYTGSESGYSNGHWYYYDGTAWQDGGVYMAGAVQTDTTLSVPGMPADAKATGDAIAAEADRVDTLLEGKADKNGNYHDMTAGTAEVVLSEVYDTDKVPYKFRRTPYKSRRLMDSIAGGTVVWNQVLRVTASSTTHNGVTFTKNDDGTWTANGTATANAYAYVTSTGGDPTWTIDHVYLASGCPAGGSMETYRMGICYADSAFRYDTGNGVVFKNTTYTSKINATISVVSGTTVTNLKYSPQIYDLTQMLGSTIADYILALETATAGAGVAFFRNLFPDAYYTYSAGELVSISGLSEHKTTGKNLFDASQLIDQSTWNVITLNVVPNTPYTMSTTRPANDLYCYFNNTGTAGGGSTNAVNSSHPVTVTSTADGHVYVAQRRAEGTDTYANYDWQVEFGTTATDYEPYTVHTYPLDSTLTLRGIPKLDSNNNLYFDGDVYESDGTVTRRYGIVDLGTLNWTYYSGEGHIRFYAILPVTAKVIASGQEIPNLINVKYIADTYYNVFNDVTDKTISVTASGQQVAVYDTAYTDAATFKASLSGVYLVYELATPTTETAAAYADPQICDPDGTEEYVSTTVVPVGHDSKYYKDIIAAVEGIPDAPTADGTYTLKVTVTNGVPVYSWEV